MAASAQQSMKERGWGHHLGVGGSDDNFGPLVERFVRTMPIGLCCNAKMTIRTGPTPKIAVMIPNFVIMLYASGKRVTRSVSSLLIISASLPPSS